MIRFEARIGVFRVDHVGLWRGHCGREVSQQATHQRNSQRGSSNPECHELIHSITVVNSAALTRFSIVPRPLISTFTRSPALSHRGGVKEAPTPPHVPVNTRSPGSRVTACVMHAIWA